MTNLSSRDYALAGSVSGALTRLLSQPFDVLKIRLQLQAEEISYKSQGGKYKSNLQALRLIVKEESIRALWKGHVPAQVLSAVYGTVQFAVFEKCVAEFAHLNFLRSDVTHFLSGAVAGCAGTVASVPLDVVRTRVVGQGEPKAYRTFRNAIAQIYLNEGVSAFYKGLVPALIQIAPYASLQFGFYGVSKRAWDHIFIEPSDFSSLKSLVCGALSGVGAKAVVYPLDVMKKRYQIAGFELARQPFGKVHHYSGFFDFFGSVLRFEGLRGLYKGFTSSLLKSGFTTALTFYFYECCCRVLKQYHGL